MLDSSISLLKEKQNSPREAIVNILSTRWPLSATDLYKAVSNENHITVTYQAIHKNLGQLEAEGIIEKHNREYRLNRHWINHVKQFGARLEDAYSNAKNGFEISPSFNGPMKFKFTNFSYLCTSLAELIRKKTLAVNEDPAMHVFFDHAIWPLEFAFGDFVLLKEMALSIGHSYGVIRRETPFDLWIAKYYRLAGGTKVLTGIEHELEKDYFVQGTSVIEIARNEETKQNMDKIYAQISSLTDLLGFYVKNKDKINLEFEVTIYKNKDFANALKEKMANIIQEAERPAGGA